MFSLDRLSWKPFLWTFLDRLKHSHGCTLRYLKRKQIEETQCTNRKHITSDLNHTTLYESETVTDGDHEQMNTIHCPKKKKKYQWNENDKI